MGLAPGNLAGDLGGAQGGMRRGGLQRNPYQQFNNCYRKCSQLGFIRESFPGVIIRKAAPCQHNNTLVLAE